MTFIKKHKSPNSLVRRFQYRSGDARVLCPVCGFKQYFTDLMIQSNNHFVCKECFDTISLSNLRKSPQIHDNRTVYPQYPEPEDQFNNTQTEDDL